MSLLVAMQGCVPWVQRPISPSMLPALREGSEVRVTTKDDRQLVLSAPYFVQDSLVGQVGSPPRHAAVALAEIARFEERGGRDEGTRSEVAKWGMLGAAVLGVALWFLISQLARGEI